MPAGGLRERLGAPVSLQWAPRRPIWGPRRVIGLAFRVLTQVGRSIREKFH
eukprot:NODE_1201_length_649_cov_8.786667_g720_i2.p2 GENE.NODE_1201_length_649_cov_8.786667_g720_i2~~NODE_1201_length_649_cov_8.786667_g720_i2.p2  ORF type:complete len:51 (-),score=0.86 NODE_1201_length_649_cov_8.786667_g720_i2:278-430(-)